MKKFKKLLAAVFAFSLAFTALPVSAAQDASGLADGTAYLNINNADWGEFEAEWTNAEITGDGSYTVAMNATEPQNLAQFNALEVVNGESVLGTGCVLTVDSIKINGEEVELQGPSFTCSADGAGVTTRVNVYNEWNAPDENATAGDDGHKDHRVAEGNLMDATAMLFSSDYLTVGITSLEVAFTVSGYGTQAEGSAPAEAELKELPAEGTTAYISMADNAWAVQYWFDGNDYSPVVANNATVTGYGQYTVGLDFTGVDGGVCPDIVFADVEVKGGEEYFPNCLMTIDSVKINGEEVALGNTYTCSDNGVDTRTNLYNSWVTEVTEGRPANGAALADCTATPLDATTIADIATIEVTFTLSEGEAAAPAEPEAPAVDPVDLDGVYHAYLGLQTPAFSFRNSFDDATYGIDSDVFYQVTGWDADNNAVSRGGTFTDVEIAGNGTYTVSVEGMDLTGDFESQDYMNLIYVSTDIPNTGEITISDVELKIDGKNVDLAEVGSIPDPDSKTYLKMLLQNIWNADVETIGYYSVPMTKMSITFTVSGFNYDAAVTEPEAPAEPTEAPANTETNAPAEESGSNTGLIVGIVVAVVVVAAVVAGVVVSKKKKETK